HRAGVVDGGVAHRAGGVEPGPRHRDAGQGGDGVRRLEHLGDDLVGGPGRVQPLDQGDHTGDVRGGHRGAADRPVVDPQAIELHGGGHVGGEGAEDIDARRAEVHRGGAVVGEGGQLVVVVGGGHGDDVVEVVAGG